MKLKKSQASFEFLMTYAWAFFAIAIVMGSIFYFGVYRPNSIISESCYSEKSFICDESSVQTDKISLILKNNVGFPINISGVDILSYEQSQSTCVLGSIDLIDKNGASFRIHPATDVATIGTYDKFRLEISCAAGDFLENDLIKVDFDMKYKVNKSGYFPKQSSISTIVRVGK